MTETMRGNIPAIVDELIKFLRIQLDSREARSQTIKSHVHYFEIRDARARRELVDTCDRLRMEQDAEHIVIDVLQALAVKYRHEDGYRAEFAPGTI